MQIVFDGVCVCVCMYVSVSLSFYVKNGDECCASSVVVSTETLSLFDSLGPKRAVKVQLCLRNIPEILQKREPDL